MSTKAGKRPMRPLSTREKLDAIHRVHDGESKASVARDIGVPESTLRGWCKNEDKIALLSRQSSSPDTESSVEHQDKRKKLDENVQPFNLSMKSTSPATGQNSYSPIPENRYSSTIEYSKTISESKAMPLDLKTKNIKDSTSPCNSTFSNQNQTEKDRNKAELARLSIELGLNRPEMFKSTLTNSSNANMADMSNINLLAAQWNNLIMQQAQAQQAKKLSPPVNNNINSANTSGGSLLTTVNQLSGTQSPLRLPNEKIPVEESVRYWLNSSTPPHLSPNSIPSTNAFPTSLSTPVSNTGNTTSPITGMTPEQNAWILKWYKSLLASQYSNAHYPMTFSQVNNEKPILYQQLTKDKEVHNAENLSITASLPEDRPGARNIKNKKARAVLDTLLLNNNNITAKREENDGELVSQHEAVTHGEKFLKWLESCSEPSVTAMQIMQFRSLLTNVKASADRKNGDFKLKTKGRRK